MTFIVNSKRNCSGGRTPSLAATQVTIIVVGSSSQLAEAYSTLVGALGRKKMQSTKSAAITSGRKALWIAPEKDASMKYTLHLLLVLCIFAGKVCGQTADNSPRTPEEYMRWMEQEKAKEARGERRPGPLTRYTPLLIPMPIDYFDLDHYSDLLNLSEAQRQRFRELLERHLEWSEAYYSKHITPLLSRSRELSAMRRNQQAPEIEAAQISKQVFAERTTAIHPIGAAEERLFSDLIPFLTDEQLQQLDRVRDQRRRDVHRQCFITRSPGANLDLSHRLWEMKREGIDCTPIDADKFDIDLREYERNATTALARISSSREQSWGEHSLLLALGNEAMSDPQGVDELYVQSIRDRLEAMGRRRHQACRAMHDLNRKYLEILGSNLSQETATSLKRWFFEKSYPVVYPDPYDAENIIEAAISLDDLNEATRVVIDSFAVQYYQTRDQSSDAMVRACLDWYKTVENRMLTLIPSENEAYQERMNDLQDRRRKAADEAIALLQSSLTPEQFDRLSAAIDERLEKIAWFERIRQRERNQGHEWPPIFS